jgi:hypothetical protein
LEHDASSEFQEWFLREYRMPADLRSKKLFDELI